MSHRLKESSRRLVWISSIDGLFEDIEVIGRLGLALTAEEDWV